MDKINNVDLRTLKPDYLILPFQAVECYFPDTEEARSDVVTEEHARSDVYLLLL